MERIHDVVAWYQKQIGTHDKQLWEQSVEKKLQAVAPSVRHAPRKNARMKTEYIDVDLVRGSAFTKAKPQVPWTYITKKAVIRVIFFPFCYKWWIQQTSFKFYLLLLFLYLLQVVSTVLYFLSVEDSQYSNEVVLTEISIPVFLMLILGLVHSQTVLYHISHKPLIRDRKLSGRSNLKPKKRPIPTVHLHPPTQTACAAAKADSRKDRPGSGASEDESKTPLSCKGTPGKVEAGTSRKDEVLLTKKDAGTNLLRLEKLRIKKRRERRSTATPALQVETDTSAPFQPSDMSDEDAVSKFEILSMDHVSEDSKTLAKDREAETVLPSNLVPCLNGLKDSLTPDTDLDTSRSEKGANDDSKNDSDFAFSGRTSTSTEEEWQKKKGGPVARAVGGRRGLRLSGVKGMKEEDNFADTERYSDETNNVHSDSEPEQQPKKEPSPGRGADPSDGGVKSPLEREGSIGRSYASSPGSKRVSGGGRGRSCSLSVSRNLQPDSDSRTEGQSDSECTQDDGQEVGAASGASVLRRRRRVVASKSADLGEVSRNRLLSAPSLHLNESEGQQETTVSSEEWEDRMQSDVTTSSSYSSTASEGEVEVGEDESLGLESEEGPEPVDMVELTQHGWTFSNIHVINLLQPTAGSSGHMPPPDKVSCVIWEGNECKKVDLTALDIGWAIIDKVDKIPESSDYILIGLAFSLIIAFVPLAFRAYLVRDLPPVFSYVGMLKVAEIIQETPLSRILLVLNGFLQRLCFSLIYFFLLSVADRTFKQRLLYAKHFCYLTSSRRARKCDMPHFRLNKVRNIKTWLSLRSYLKRRGPQRSVDVIVSATFYLAVTLLSVMCLQLLRSVEAYMDYLWNWEILVWTMALGIYLWRFMTLGLKINKKYRNLSVLITEQINLYLQMEQKPHKKDELMLANNVLKLAEDLLKELESPFRISGFTANPVIYNITRVVVLSAFSAVLTELLGFKLKLYKIKLKS